MKESQAADTLDRLIKVIGRADECPRCDAEVFKVLDDQGRIVTINPNGVVHWLGCTSQTRLGTLLRTIGSKGECRSCKRRVLWIKTKDNNNAIYDPDGISHWATCPSAERHRKPKGETDAAASDQD